MKKDARYYGLWVVTLWDATTTVWGSMKSIGDNTLQIIVSIALALFLTGYCLLRAYPILKNPSNDLGAVIDKGLLFVAVSWDLYTAFLGNLHYVIKDNADIHGVIMAIIITLATCSAPILLSIQPYSQK